MYYDPMISKLITWGKDRKSALELLGNAMDEYVIRGVVHNVGFGRSILRNESFAAGNYTTAFIPTFYPEGFRGDPLSDNDHHQLAIAAHFLKNHKRQEIAFPDQVIKPVNIFYVTIKEDDHDRDFKIEKLADCSYTVTDIINGKAHTFSPKDFDFDYNSLLRFDLDGSRKLIQFLDVKAEVNYSFYYKGNTVQTHVWDAAQYKLKKYMAAPKKVDYAKSVLSPMPGLIVNIAVEVGQVVVDGQDLYTIEAMKMQNNIKSQVDGKIKKIIMKSGDSVSVDQVLIEYE